MTDEAPVPDVDGELRGSPPRDHPVVQLLRSRLEAGSVPGHRADPYRLGLVVEGGGMRGVVSGGMLAGLEQMRVRPAFDVVYGASAGAIGAPFFLADQAIYGLEIYYNRLNAADFIDYRRALAGSPILSVDYLIDEVVRSDKHLAVDRVLEGATELKIATSAVDRNRCELLGGFDEPEELYRALRAAVALPLITGDPVEIDGRRFMDAALTEPIPFPSAFEDGCTHVLCLLSRPIGAEDTPPNFLKRMTFGRAIRSLSDELAALYEDRAYLYDGLLRELEVSTADPGEPPHLCGLAVERDAAEVDVFERDTDALLRGGKAGYTSAVELFVEEEVETVVALRAVDADGRVIPPPGGGSAG